MCLTHWTTEKDPRQGSPVSAWTGGPTEKDWPEAFWSSATRGSRKDSDRAMTTAEAVRIPAHLVLPESLQAKQLCHLHAQLLLGQTCHRQKKSCFYARRVTLVVSNSLWPCWLWPARLLCQRSSLGKNTGTYWPVLVVISCCPSHQLPWCCQNPCNPSSCNTSILGPHWANPGPPGQPQEQTPVDDPHAEVEIKPQLKPRGSVAKEEDPKPPHQLAVQAAD